PGVPPAAPPGPPPAGAAPPVFLDLETRSAADIRDGGRAYARHPTTEVLSAAALVDGRVVAWAPLLAEPLPAGGLWPEGFGPALPVESFAGPELPGPPGDPVAAGRALCARNAGGSD